MLTFAIARDRLRDMMTANPAAAEDLKAAMAVRYRAALPTTAS